MENQNFELDVLNKNISSADRKIRQDALNALLGKCSTPDIDSNLIQHIYDQFYLAVFKCYSDRFETCRSLACSIVQVLLEKLPTNDYYAEYAISMIARRIGQSEIIEDSEEMRLMLLQQVTAIVRKYGKTTEMDQKDHLIQCYNDIIDILIKTLRDPFRDIQLECCRLIDKLANATKCFPLRAEALIAPLLPMLEHRQSPNRRAAVKSLGILALHIQSNGDSIGKIITSILPLLMDPMPAVRLECGLVGCRWLLELQDRYSFFERILPLVLCCLKDDTIEIREKVQEQWKLCGRQYFAENEKELSELELVDVKPKKYPSDIERPSLGCRAIMQQRCIRIIYIVLRELQDWKDEVRFHAIRLLWQVILYSEKALTPKFIEILPVLSKCCMDKEKHIQMEAKRAAKLLGNLLDYSVWIKQGLQELKHSTSIGVLACFSKMFNGADEKEKAGDIKNIAILLSDPSKVHSLKEHYQEELLNLTDQLVDLMLSTETQFQCLNLNATDETIENSIEKLLYEILVKIIALSPDHTDIHSNAKLIIQKLTSTSRSLTQLHGQYLAKILTTIDDLDVENSERAEPIILLHGIIIYCGFQMAYIEPLKNAIKLVLDNGTAGAKIKILSGTSVAMLTWTNTMQTTFEESLDQVKAFFTEIIEPCLIWHAGRNSESLRAMGTTVLCAMGQGAPDVAYKLFPKFAIHFGQLIDDNNMATRGYALKCLLNCGPMKYEALKPLALGVLARLDDPSSEIRECATRIIGQLKLDSDANEFDVDGWNTVNQHILSVLLLHLDDTEIKLRPILLKSIRQIRKNHKTIYENALSKLPKDSPHWNELEAL